MNEIFLTISRSLIFPFLDCQVIPPTPIEFFIIFPQEVFKTDRQALEPCSQYFKKYLSFCGTQGSRGSRPTLCILKRHLSLLYGASWIHELSSLPNDSVLRAMEAEPEKTNF